MEQQAGQKSLLKMNASAIDGVVKTLKVLITAALIAIIAVIFSGCNKEVDVKKTTCRIVTATIVSTGDAYRFLYNSEGKLARATFKGNAITYDYTDNTTVVTTFDAGVFHSKAIVSLNAAGLATNVRTENNAAGTVWSNEAFEYNGVELNKSTATSSAGGSPVITTYTWSNGNLRTDGSAVFDYYTDKPRQAGDFLLFTQLLRGYETYRTKNLIKAMSNGNFSYQFTPDGNISSVAVAASSTIDFLDYEYQCN